MQLKSLSSTAALALIVGLTTPALGQQPAPSNQPSPAQPAAPTQQRTEPSQSAPSETTTSQAGKRAAQPLKNQILSQAANTRLTRELLGSDVNAVDKGKVASVADLIHKEDGSIDGIVLEVGGFLGLGGRNVAIGMEGVQIREQNGRLAVLVPVTAAELESAPHFITKAQIQADKEAARQREQPAQKPNPKPQM